MKNCEYCANRWCASNGIFKLSDCKDFYGRTFIEIRKAGGHGCYDRGWYDDRIESVNVEIYNLD